MPSLIRIGTAVWPPITYARKQRMFHRAVRYSYRKSVCPSRSGIVLKWLNISSQFVHYTVAQSLPPTKEEVNVFARVCLSVCMSVCLPLCLLARLLKNEWMDLDEMLHVHRCRDMTKWLTFEPGSDYSPDAGTGLISPISHKRCYAEFYIGKIPRTRIGGVVLERAAVLYGLIHWAVG